MKLSRAEYARQFGPTTGDLIRLGDTDLWVRVEADDVGYGDEPVWGYAKNWRSRQAQDVEVLRRIRREFGGRLALNAQVLEDGVVSKGDPAELL